jgi:site-specific recombinase XerC
LDWLVTGHVIDVNPAHAVRGPKYVVKKGKTPVLAADEARTLLDSIPIVKAVAEDGAAVDRPDLVGLRDRALIGLMAYSFARVSAVLQIRSAIISCRNAGDGCASMRRAARSMTFPVTTILIIS